MGSFPWFYAHLAMTNGLGALKMQLGVQGKGSTVGTPCTIQMAKPLEAFADLVPKQLKQLVYGMCLELIRAIGEFNIKFF